MRQTEAARLLSLQRQAREEREAWVRQTTQAARRLRSQGAALRSGAGTLAWTVGVALAVRLVWRGLAAGSGQTGSVIGSGVGSRPLGVLRRTLRWGRRLSAIVAAVRLFAPAGPVTRRTTGVRTERTLSGLPPRG